MSAIVQGKVQGKPLPRTETGAFPLFQSLPVMLVVAFAAILAGGAKLALSVWSDGGFVDTDDAMRMVQVRDFLAGKAWFDLVEHRLNPPLGVIMHWSRFIDAPVAFLIRAFELVLEPVAAERLARIVWPLLLHMASAASFITTARRLMGDSAIAPAAFLTPLIFATVGQFIPGRIDHHNAEILLMLLMLRATIEALEPRTRSRFAAALAGVLAMLALAISLEDLPFVAAMALAFGIAWLMDGENMRDVLGAFALALSSAAVVAFVTTVPPRDFGVAYCDNYTIPHAFAATAGGAALAVLAGLSPRLTSWSSRLMATAIAGVGLLAALALTFPACLGDPLAATEPLVRELWLKNVSEARPLLRAIAEQPALFVAATAPLLVGVGAILAAFKRVEPTQRLAWLPVLSFAIVGLGCAAWQVRMLSPTATLAAFGGVWLVAMAVAASWRTRAVQYAAVALAFFAVCPTAWSIALDPLSPAAHKQQDEQAAQCLKPQSLAALRGLATGLILAPIDLGAHILAFTPHSVLAAPYHRNNYGNRIAIDAMIGNDERARDIVARRGVTYVVTCPGLSELRIYDSHAPQGFSAALKRGEPAAWLEPLAGQDARAPLKVYRPRL
jgi:hypothetical protein